VQEWLVGDEEEFEAGERRIVDLGGIEVAVLRVGDAFHAYDNRCLHMGGPVGEGTIIGRVEAVLADDKRVLGERFSDDLQLVCPWHGWAYDLETGACAGDPRRRLMKRRVSVRDGQVFVRA
jgi:nitrite reductase/ring-hydroxylating ferredoxin subunit